MSYSPLDIVNYSGSSSGNTAAVTLDNLIFRYNSLTTIFELATVSGTENVIVFLELSAAGVNLPSVSIPLVLTTLFVPVGIGLLSTVGSARRRFTISTTGITDTRQFEVVAHSISVGKMALSMRLVR